MTGEEARERVAAAFHDEGGCLENEPWETAGPNHRARFLKATEAALKTLGLDWTQAAALMSGEAEVTGWLPIATAPKDGTVIDLWYPRGPFRMTDASWFEGDWWFRGEVEDEHWKVGMRDGPSIVQPTHWMPRPAPPRLAVSPASEKETPNGT